MELIQMDANRLDRYYDSRLVLNFRSKAVTMDQKLVKLTNVEYRLLALLAKNVGNIVPRADLLKQVWGYSTGIRTRTLDVHIRRLRCKINDVSRQHIETIFGIGYRLQPQSETGSSNVTSA